MNDNKVITIVIPIYNVEPYLNHCLDSVLEQNSKQVEVIMVDDGSSDNSYYIALDYAEKYQDIFKLVRQENQGAGIARNKAISLVKTEYLTFLDSDDFLKSNTIKYYLQAIEKYHPDMLLCEPICFSNVTKKYLPWYDKEILDKIVLENDVVFNVEKAPDLYNIELSMCRRLIKTSILKDNNFTYYKELYDDILPHYQSLYWSKSVVFVNDAGFIYRVDNSSSLTATSNKRILECFKTFDQLFKYTKEINNPVMAAYSFKYFIHFINWNASKCMKTIYLELIEKYHQFLLSIDEFIIESFKKQAFDNQNALNIYNAIKAENYKQYIDKKSFENLLNQYPTN